jgi:3-dehydroquinate synthetase
MDKKKNAQSIHYILLQKIGKAVIQSLSFAELEAILKQY